MKYDFLAVNIWRLEADDTYCLDGFLEPFLVLKRDEAVSDDPTTLVFPQGHQHVGGGDDLRGSHQQTLPDSAEISQVEDVVELCRGRQHLVLHPLPQHTGGGDQHLYHLTHFFREASIL